MPYISNCLCISSSICPLQHFYVRQLLATFGNWSNILTHFMPPVRKPQVFYVFRGYRKRPRAQNGLSQITVKFTDLVKTFLVFLLKTAFEYFPNNQITR